MDHLHATLAQLQAENKSAQAASTSHLTVFREFLAQLERLQQRPARDARDKSRTRKQPRRARG